MKKLLFASVTLAIAAVPAAARQLTIDDVTMLSRVGVADGVARRALAGLATARDRSGRRQGPLRPVAARPDEEGRDARKAGRRSRRQRNRAAILARTARRSISSPTRAATMPSGRSRSLAARRSKLTAFQGRHRRLQGRADRRQAAGLGRSPAGRAVARAGDGQEGRRMPAAARTYDQLFVRHWDTWSRRHALATVRAAARPTARRAGNGVAIEGGLVGDTPSKPYGGGEEIVVERRRQDRLFRAARGRDGSSRCRPISTSSRRPPTDRRRRST